ncbi:FAD:protein FMN transferase [Thalassococcus lentus]|uniref:FAD:protein FMN transferase n=1 Tax=Thalassococcus lentus TaxID=1210524 RepID=A0ABT4XQX0_9RHOB|nr:FAD:protein FMN transferase [Thalassococcus lentus]MDA7424349.1 FAD:protein FMN transferase [Thalassococcus lentus]
MMNRRRFLSLSAAFACAPRLAQAQTWSGYALGADVAITLSGPRQLVDAELQAIPERINELENRFSLYRPGSDLSRLNRDGWIWTDAAFSDLIKAADTAHGLSDGLFDPTVQSLWSALATGADPEPARQLIGWHKVRHDPLGKLRIEPGQKLTFNGIAQGYVTDVIRNRLKARGFERALINIGEYSAIGGPFRLGLSDPEHGILGQRTLRHGALATSSPSALPLGSGATHILGPQGQSPIWSTVSIEGPTAVMADALSTAAVFMTQTQLVRLKKAAALYRITVVGPEGDLRSI